jgi:sugar phosphate isomerase/epimerase
MVTAVSVCMELGIVPYFENTYEPLNWLIPFFDELIALGIAPAMGFCMDIGHVNVWGRATLDAFYVLAKNLRTAGFAQHFHIHANDGHADAHIALHTAYTEGLLAASAKWAPAGVLPWLATAMAEYPTTLFTLENKQAESDEALAFTLLATE